MERRWQVAALVALLVAQVLHALPPPPEDAPDTGSVVGPVGGIGFLAATAFALLWFRREDPRGPRLALVIGAVVPISFLLYHGAWFDSPVTNPYWGDGSATAAQWATLVPVVLASLWVVFATRPRIAGHP